jgi:glucose dehydrogenase
VTDGRRQPAAVIGAKIVLLGALVWGVWRIERAETGE